VAAGVFEGALVAATAGCVAFVIGAAEFLLLLLLPLPPQATAARQSATAAKAVQWARLISLLPLYKLVHQYARHSIPFIAALHSRDVPHTGQSQPERQQQAGVRGMISTAARPWGIQGGRVKVDIEELLVERAERAYAAFFCALASSAPDHAIVEDDDMLLVASGSGLPMLNWCCLWRPLSDPEAVLARARRFYRGRTDACMLEACGAAAAAIKPAADGGSTGYMERVRMVLPGGEQPTVVPDVPGLRVEQVRDAGTFAVYNGTMTAGFGGAPWARLESLDTNALLGVAGTAHYVSFVDGRPVGTAMRVGRLGVTVIANVSVVPAYRRRGIGEALTWRAIFDGRAEGDTASCLQASAMGQPIYARMGFQLTRPWSGWLIKTHV